MHKIGSELKYLNMILLRHVLLVMFTEKSDILWNHSLVHHISAPYLGDITIPTGISKKKVSEQLKGKIADGTYRIGNLITSQ